MPYDRSASFLVGGLVLALSVLAAFFWNLRAPARTSSIETNRFVIEKGEGFRYIAGELHKHGLIRSPSAFTLLAFLKGELTKLKPGRYEIDRGWSAQKILHLLVEGSRREVSVRIPEGVSRYEIDRILASAGVLSAGSLLGYPESESLEGKLFPDTYRFFTDSPVEEVLSKFKDNFESKAAPILAGDPEARDEHLVLASLLEKEVPDFEERRIVAGILKKRIEAGVPLQVDAAICYVKHQRNIGNKGQNCHPITALDLKIDSPYNTYLYSGWPPGPIGSPGTSSLIAAMSQKKSPYWFYLSDPLTKRTIFAATLEEHHLNEARYLAK